MAETAQEYPRFPMPNELDSLNTHGQTGMYGKIGQNGQHGQDRHHSYRTEQHQVQHVVSKSSSSTGQGLRQADTFPRQANFAAVQGHPDMMGRGESMTMAGMPSLNPAGMHMQGIPGVMGRSVHTTMPGVSPQNPAGMHVEFPPDVAAMMLADNDQQRYDINEKHHEVIHEPHGRTDVYSKHQKRDGVNSTYENQAMMSFTTQHFDSNDPPPEDSEDQYDLRLVGATDVETGDHLRYPTGTTYNIGTETPSEDSLSSFSHASQQFSSVSTQGKQQKYGSLQRSFSDSNNVQSFTQHLAKIGNTGMEAVSLESLASFTQQQAKEWEESPSEDSSSGYEQRRTKVGFTTTTTQESTTRHKNDMVHTLPPKKPKYDMSQSHPPPKPQYNTMRPLTSEMHQEIQTSHRTHSTSAFQPPVRTDQTKEYYAYDVRPGFEPSPSSSVGSSRIDITVNITEQPTKVQSETLERTTSTTTQMVQGSSDQNITRRPPPPVMPKPPKTPDSLTPGYGNYTERLTIRGVVPGDNTRPSDSAERLFEQAASEGSTDVTSDVFDSDVEAMMQAASVQPPKQGEDHIQYVDGRCSCCPYGYHIDLTFLGFMADKDNVSDLAKLKQIKRNKRNLRKSMEVYMQSQDPEHPTPPPPDIVKNESLLNMVERHEKATKGILNEIDSSVNETIESIDTLMKSGPSKKRPKAPDTCDSDYSVSSGPQTTSSPRPVHSLNNTGSTSSLSSLDSNDKNAQLATSKPKKESKMSSSHTEHHTTTMTNVTNIITSQQIAKSVEDCLNDSNVPATDPNVVTPDQLQAIRDQMKLSLQRMRDLEEQVKAVPVLQVRISVLKEEKRLMSLQMEALKNKKPTRSNMRSVGVETDQPRMRSVGVEATRPRMKTVGSGECTVDEVESTPPGRRSRSQSPSGRSFEITEFQSYRRNNLTPMNKYFGKTSSGRTTPVSFDGPETVDSAVGNGDVSKPYYNQPDLVTEAQFLSEMNGLRPDNVPELVRSVDKEQEEFDALERSLSSPVSEYARPKPIYKPNERGDEILRKQKVPTQELGPDGEIPEELVTPRFTEPRFMSSVPIVKDDFLKPESMHPEEDEVDSKRAPRTLGPPSEDGSPYRNEPEVTVKVAPTEQSFMRVSHQQPELKKASKTIGIGDGDVFEEPKPVVIKPVKPQTRNVGMMFQAATRDVGMTFVSEAPEKPKPKTRDIGVGIGDLEDMKVIETGEFGEYYHTVPMTDEMLSERQKGMEDSQMVTYSQGGSKSQSPKSIRTTSTTTYTERRNILLQEERIKTALRDALHRSVKSVGITCKMSSKDQSCGTDSIKSRDKGCGDDSVDVEVRPVIEIRSIGVDVKPQRINKSTSIDKPFTYNAMTNTPTPQPKEKSTNTTKVLTYPASIQTENKRTYSVNVGTDMKVFMATDQIKNTAVNTDETKVRNAETNTERKALKSENYDFSIYFRDGASNTPDTSVKDLKLQDRGQNTMRPGTREREIEEHISAENQRPAFAAVGQDGTDNKRPEFVTHGQDGTDNKRPGFVTRGQDGAENQRPGFATRGQDGAENQRPGFATLGQDGAENQRPGFATLGPYGAENQQPGFATLGQDGAENQRPGFATLGPDGAENQRPGFATLGQDAAENQRPGLSTLGQDSTDNKRPGFATLGPDAAENQRPGFATVGPDGAENQRPGLSTLGPDGSENQRPGFAGSQITPTQSITYETSPQMIGNKQGGGGGFGGSMSSGGMSGGGLAGGSMSGDRSVGDSMSSGGMSRDGSSSGSMSLSGGGSFGGSGGSSGGSMSMSGGRSFGVTDGSSGGSMPSGGSSSGSMSISGGGSIGVTDGSSGGSMSSSRSSGGTMSSGGSSGGSMSMSGGSITTGRSSGGAISGGSSMSAGSSSSSISVSSGGSAGNSYSSGGSAGGSMSRDGFNRTADGFSSSSNSTVSGTSHGNFSSSGGSGSAGGNMSTGLRTGSGSSLTVSSGGFTSGQVDISNQGGGLSGRNTLDSSGGIVRSEVSDQLSSAPTVLGGAGSVRTLSSDSFSQDSASAPVGKLMNKPGSLDLSGSSSMQFSSTTTKITSGGTRIGSPGRPRRSSGEKSIQEMMGGNFVESKITASETSELESGVGTGDLQACNADGSLIFENKAVMIHSSSGSSTGGSESGFMSRSSSGGMSGQQSESSSVMTSSGGSVGEESVNTGSSRLGGGITSSGLSSSSGVGSLQMSIGGQGSSVSGAGGMRMMTSTSEKVRTYSSSGSSTSSLDTTGEDQLSSLPGETKDSVDGDNDGSDSEQSQSDVFGQENNGTIIRKHVMTTRSSIPIRNSRKEIRILRTVDQNGNENSNRLSPSPTRTTAFQQSIKTFGSGNRTTFGLTAPPMRSPTILESSTEMLSSSGTSSPTLPSSDTVGTGFSSYVSGGEISTRGSYASRYGKTGVSSPVPHIGVSSPVHSRTIISGSTETTYISSNTSPSSGSETGLGVKLQGFGSGGQMSSSVSVSPGGSRTVIDGSATVVQSSSGGEKDQEVLAQLRELEKDIESSHAKHLESMSMDEYEAGSLEADVTASHEKHFESMKSKFLSGSLNPSAIESSESGQSFLTTGAINLTPGKSSQISSTSVKVSVGGSDPEAIEGEVESEEVFDEELAAENTMSKSVSEGSLEHSEGSDASIKSIMKRSGSFEGNKGQKKELKFAVGTMGGAVKTIEHTQSYVSTSSDEGTSESDSECDSDTDESFEEGSYDGRQGCIVYRCEDDEAIAQGIPGAKMFDQNIRETFELNPEMKNACIVYGAHLQGEQQLSEEEQKVNLTNIQTGWFKVSSERLSNPHQVEDYLSSFNEVCRELLPLVINMADTNGNCAVHYAVSHCNFEIVQLLLDTEQCDVNKQNRAGYTPIMLASLAQVQTDRHKDIVRRLFREGNVNIKASQAGQTALMLAVSHGKKDMVKLLLDCGADINAQDEDGSTALMCASEHGHTDIVKVLLAQQECDPSVVDQDGSTALAIAMEAGHRDIAVLLYAKRGPKSPVRSPVSGFHQFKFKGKSPPQSPKLSHWKN